MLLKLFQNFFMQVGKAEIWNKMLQSYTTAYTLQAYDLALRDVAHFCCKVVYTGDVIHTLHREISDNDAPNLLTIH